MRDLMKFAVLLAGSTCVFNLHAHASNPPVAYQSLSSIQALAEQHLLQLLPDQQAKVHLQADALDSRLHLALCAEPLQAFLPSGASLGSRATVGVRCNTGNTWSVYVPVNIESEVSVLSLNKALPRDAIVNATDVLRLTRRVPGLSNQYLQDIDELQGKRLKHELPAGALLTPNQLQTPTLIRRGQQVTLLAVIGGIEVRNQGIALADANVNTRIRVRNLNSAKVVEGLVDNDSQVRVAL